MGKLRDWLKGTQEQLNAWGKGKLKDIYDMSPQMYGFRESEAAQLRAEQREKEYNDPKAQMQRMKDAGLNPALLYGGGASGASGNVGSSAPKLDAPSGILAYVLNGIQIGAQIANTSSATSLRATQEDVNKTRLGEIQARTMLMHQNFDQLSKINPGLARLIESRADMSELDQKIQTEIGYTYMARELDRVLKQNNLLEKDGELKDEVLRGKKLQNELLQAERDFIMKGDFNTKQFWQGLMMMIRMGGSMVPSLIKK